MVLMVTLEKRTISYLSVSVPEFSQMNGEYGTIMNDADSANRINHLRALHDALRETFLKVTNNEI